MKRPPKTVRETYTESQIAFVENRIFDIVRECAREPNIVRSVALSCYLQGLIDGAQVVTQRPEIAGLLWEPHGK